MIVVVVVVVVEVVSIRKLKVQVNVFYTMRFIL